MTTSRNASIPTHVGLIIDGNRRWAKEHGLPPWEGHVAGITALEDVLRSGVVPEGARLEAVQPQLIERDVHHRPDGGSGIAAAVVDLADPVAQGR